MASLLWQVLRVRVLPLVLLLAVSCAGRTDSRSEAQGGQTAAGERSRSEAREQLLRTLEENMERAAQSPEAAATFRSFERRQAAALENMASARFVMARMNPGAGLGNRMVALVSAFVLSIATDRALLIEWESYAEPRTHRSLEVSTMSPIETFVELPFAGDTSAILTSDKDVKAFGWDYRAWQMLHDERGEDLAALLTEDLRVSLKPRVVVLSAISHLTQLLVANPHLAAPINGMLGANPFPAAARYLLAPAPPVRAAVAKFYLERMAGRGVVGVHLRTIEYMTLGEQETALGCARFLAAGGAASVFVASDTPAGMILARKVLGDGFLRYETVGPGREGERALLDGWANVLLLSKADSIVGTSRSSFALLAAGLNGGGGAGEGGGSRPLYDVYGDVCVKVSCYLPVVQRDHPAARRVPAFNASCLEGSPRVTIVSA